MISHYMRCILFPLNGYKNAFNSGFSPAPAPQSTELKDLARRQHGFRVMCLWGFGLDFRGFE
ncbi:hypothetical protein ACFDR9_003785, partial [Janthinobacterium sp. CG_23.3]|uniref:hypothetical protein n=1 Tax=Janthinobacterium sp. CG_23.3 TaxID=3349634 RepID=UPI0038D4201B